jgi:hypothetical protein
MSATFKDRQDKAWDLTLTVGTVRAVRDRVGVDLFDAATGEPFVQIAGSPELLVDTIWAIVEDQAADAEIDEVAFAKRLDGGAIERATEALIEAVIGFFGRPGQREILGEIRNKVDTILTTAETAQLEKIRDPATAAALEEEVRKALDGETSSA